MGPRNLEGEESDEPHALDDVAGPMHPNIIVSVDAGSGSHRAICRLRRVVFSRSGERSGVR